MCTAFVFKQISGTCPILVFASELEDAWEALFNEYKGLRFENTRLKSIAETKKLFVLRKTYEVPSLSKGKRGE